MYDNLVSHRCVTNANTRNPILRENVSGNGQGVLLPLSSLPSLIIQPREHSHPHSGITRHPVYIATHCVTSQIITQHISAQSPQLLFPGENKPLIYKAAIDMTNTGISVQSSKSLFLAGKNSHHAHQPPPPITIFQGNVQTSPHHRPNPIF
jgi:hypothetical protein